MTEAVLAVLQPPVPLCTRQFRFDFCADVAAAVDLKYTHHMSNTSIIVRLGAQHGYSSRLHSPTREVGNALDSGTDPCRFAGDVERLPGALVDAALFGSSGSPTELVAAGRALASSMLAKSSKAAANQVTFGRARSACLCWRWPLALAACAASSRALARS